MYLSDSYPLFGKPASQIFFLYDTNLRVDNLTDYFKRLHSLAYRLSITFVTRFVSSS